MSIEMKLLKVTLQMLIYILFRPFFKYIFKFHKMMVKFLSMINDQSEPKTF